MYAVVSYVCNECHAYIGDLSAEVGGSHNDGEKGKPKTQTKTCGACKATLKRAENMDEDQTTETAADHGVMK
ncbi:hypothetical protein AU210_016394 [Fusarium oxysporum f. sp. radicis-cucumerinum]|uniref:Uncharacterized protein n=1 Tax=Fusarium oxysporum f. sp. radicis-cucumerinum TaxID=327505 RepID=A0A2H3FP87_FUSOX|nr:hypothetical protein AU210_016394 [Fusarium oxysporum f. sp. radicis-cucumerinum]